MTDTLGTKTPKPVAGLADFDPTNRGDVQTVMSNTARTARFLSQSFKGRRNLDHLDDDGFRGLSVILASMAGQIEAMQGACEGMAGGRRRGGGRKRNAAAKQGGKTGR